MGQLDRADIEAALAKKGFVLRVGDHRYYRLLVDGKETGIQTYLSTGSSYKTYSDSLLGQMARQLGLKKAELIRLVQCQLDGPAYLALLRASGYKI